MEVLLQYWDELDDAIHSARFALLRSPLRWGFAALAAVLLGTSVAVI